MKKNIIIVIILFLIFSTAGGVIYLNNFYLPVTFKHQLTKILETQTNYNVRIGKIKYDLIRGVVIDDIAIFDQTEDKANTILSIKEISSNVLFLALIKERKIILPVIYVDSPLINIGYLRDGTLNFKKALQPKKPQKQKSPFSFLVYKINISNAKCLFRDERFSPAFTKSLQDFTLGVHITPWAKIAFLLRGRLTTNEKTFTKLNIEGGYNLLSRETAAKIVLANLDIAEYDQYLNRLPFTIISGNFDTVDLDIRFKDNILSVKGPADIKELKMKIRDFLLEGNVAVSPQLVYAFDKRKLSYKTNFNFKQARVSNVPYVGVIENLVGEAGLEEDKLYTSNLKLRVLDSDFNVSGQLQNFALPNLKLKISSPQVDLAKITPLLPPDIQKNLSLSGKTKLEANIDGNLKDVTTTSKVKLALNDAAVQLTSVKSPFSDISGEVEISPQGLSWKRLLFNYLNNKYLSSGKLDNFKSPRLNFNLKAKDLVLETDISTKNNLAQINRLVGKFRDSDFNAKGTLGTQDITNPYCDLAVRMDLKTQDLSALPFPALSQNLQKINLQGTFIVKGTLKGALKNYEDWLISLKANSESFAAYGFNFTNLSLNLEQKDGLINIPRLMTYCYSGVINANAVVDLKVERPTYTLQLTASGIDLGKLKMDTPIKDKDVSGILELDGSLTSYLNNINSAHGRVNFTIAKGKLWQLDLLKGLGELILLPDYNKLVFNKAEAEFIIANRAFTTGNLVLSGDQVTLEGTGSIGFDGGLAFAVNAKVNQELLKDSTDIRKFMTAILGEISNAISINVSGTIKQPKYTLVPLSADLIKSIKDLILGK